MKRAFLIVLAPLLLIVAVGGATAARASAASEFCPAKIDVFTPLDGKTAATLYSFALDAKSARHVAADVAVDTNAGWYSVKVRPTVLNLRIEHLELRGRRFQRTVFTSAPLYVRFPSALKVLDAFVLSASAPDETRFGWGQLGRFTCQAPAGFGLTRPASPYQVAIHNTSTRTDLSRMPAAGEFVAQARLMTPPGSTACAHPFLNASVVRAAPASYPFGVNIPYAVNVGVRISISPGGRLVDARVYAPSGYRALDAAALSAARRSIFRAGRSFCESAPGTYLFWVRFSPF